MEDRFAQLGYPTMVFSLLVRSSSDKIDIRGAVEAGPSLSMAYLEAGLASWVEH